VQEKDTHNIPISVQFSSVHFDLITQEMLHLQLIGGFHAGPGLISGGW